MIRVISKDGNKAQIVIIRNGKSITKHLLKQKDGRYTDNHGIPFSKI